jgi:hypothetical protein
MREASFDLVQKLVSTSSWLNTELEGPASGNTKTRPSSVLGSGQYFCGKKLV